MTELILGAGRCLEKRLVVNGQPEEFQNLVRLDNNADHKPDVVWDLTQHPLPFKDGVFDEVHAYEVLEHLAQQGDFEFFFAEFSEYWRILKPGGLFCASVPGKASIWALGDPSHKRIIVPENLIYLRQKTYEEQVGKTAISDFRSIYKADFETLMVKYIGEPTQQQMYFALMANK